MKRPLLMVDPAQNLRLKAAVDLNRPLINRDWAILTGLQAVAPPNPASRVARANQVNALIGRIDATIVAVETVLAANPAALPATLGAAQQLINHGQRLLIIATTYWNGLVPLGQRVAIPPAVRPPPPVIVPLVPLVPPPPPPLVPLPPQLVPLPPPVIVPPLPKIVVPVDNPVHTAALNVERDAQRIVIGNQRAALTRLTAPPALPLPANVPAINAIIGATQTAIDAVQAALLANPDASRISLSRAREVIDRGVALQSDANAELARIAQTAALNQAVVAEDAILRGHQARITWLMGIVPSPTNLPLVNQIFTESQAAIPRLQAALAANPDGMQFAIDRARASIAVAQTNMAEAIIQQNRIVAAFPQPAGWRGLAITAAGNITAASGAIGGVIAAGANQVVRAGTAVAGAARAASPVIAAGARRAAASAVKALTPAPPMAVAPPPPVGDPDFFPRLQATQSALEKIRIAEARYNVVTVWNPPANQNQLILLFGAAKPLALQSVTGSLRFIAQMPTDPTVDPNLIGLIEGAVTAVNDAAREIDAALNANAAGQAIPATATVGNLNLLTGNLQPLVIQGLLPGSSSEVAMRVAVPIAARIQNDLPPSLPALSDADKEIVAAFDIVVIRNLAADAINLPLIYPPEVPPAALPAVAVAIGRNIVVKRITTTKTIDLDTGKKWYERVNFPGRTAEPTVKDLRSGFDKKSSELLKAARLGQSKEITEKLVARREADLKTSLPVSYTSDIGGTIPPSFPTVVTGSLLPFVLIANILLSAQPSGSDGSPIIEVQAIEKIRAIDSLMALTITMTEPRRLLADNLEATFGASYFGYFVELSGVKIVERMAQMISDMNTWTNTINKMDTGKTKESDIIYAERAMLSINSAVTDYCEVSRPRTGGVCELLADFANPPRLLVAPIPPIGPPAPLLVGLSNVTRSAALRRMATAAKTANARSVFGDPLSAFCDALDKILTNVAYGPIRLTKIDVKGEFVKSEKSEGSAEERTLKSITEIHNLFKNVDYNNTSAIIDWKVVDRFLDNLDNVVRDLAAIEGAQKTISPARETDLRDVVSDLRAALTQIRQRQEASSRIPGIPSRVPAVAWTEGKRIVDPNFLANWNNANPNSFDQKLKAALRILYRDVAFVSNSEFNTGVAQGIRTGKKQPTALPASQTVDFALKAPGLQNLPAGIDKIVLVGEIQKNRALPTDRQWYDNLGKAIANVYGSQTTKTRIPYDLIAQELAAAVTVQDMEKGLIKIALPTLVSQMTNSSIPLTTLKIDELGEQLYTDLAASNLALGTEVIAKAIADVIPRVPTGIALDPRKVSRALANMTEAAAMINQPPSIADISRVLIAEATMVGAAQSGKVLTAIPTRQDSVQQRLANAIARVGGFAGGPPPAWTGISVPK